MDYSNTIDFDSSTFLFACNDFVIFSMKTGGLNISYTYSIETKISKIMWYTEMVLNYKIKNDTW